MNTMVDRVGLVAALASGAAGLAAALLLAALVPVFAGTGAPVPKYVQRVALSNSGVSGLPGVAGSGDQNAPLVVIDPGHGGFDPGAVAQNGAMEKDVVLGLAKSLRARLLEQGGVRVAMTRSDDRFLPLEERSSIARQLDADLFISIHADSGGDEMNAAGASIYTLSPQASGREAARFAARENNADVVNGTRLNTGSGEVDAILFELSQRRAKQTAAEFARLVVRESAGRLKFREPPTRSAALVVLTAPDVPSVLFEAGFITNPAEATRLTSREGREEFARVTAAAIRSFFARGAAVPQR